ncbi:MAG TPA: efflux RND transporter permease subunit [Candidatus Macondimonas sp.]|nr:efflux RND transporter permease subunit [Candidatus Macondimonas sp.]
MNPGAFFIHRPVATTLLTLAITLSGLLGFSLMPVAPMPQIDFPTIVVIARLPGASPETMATTVATPLERQLGRIAGIEEMSSASSIGFTRIIIQFDVNRNIDGAARDVQAAINAARSLLPANMPTNPIYRKANPADSPVLVISLTSDTLTPGQMYDAASTVLAQKLSQVLGVGQVELGGSALPAVRVELNLDAVNKYGLGLEQIRQTLAGANANRPKGFLEDGEIRWLIHANDQAKTADAFRDLVIAFVEDSPVYLRDIAEVRDSVQDVRNAGTANGKPAVLITLRRQPGANVIETVDRVKALLPELKASVPGGVDLTVELDQSETIRASLHEVELTIVIAIVLVLGVVLLFLRNARATLIPAVALPVSLIGTFGALYLMGYTIDNLSLMAITIATGFVVDDVIVVLENIIRHLEQGSPPFQAALDGTREVSFTVVSMTLSLVAVFLPIVLMGGMIGRLIQEFGATLSIAVLVSMVVSLTLTPMMSARLLRAETFENPGRLHRWVDRRFERMVALYRVSLDWALRHSFLTLMSLFATFAFNIFLFVVVPKGLMPQYDIGKLLGYISGEQALSFQSMQEKQQQFTDILRADPAVESVVSFIGGESQGNTGFVFVSLKPLDQRQMPAHKVMERLRTQVNDIPGATLFLQGPQDIRPGGRPANSRYQYTLQSDNLEDLYLWAPRLEAALKESPQLVDVNNDLKTRGLHAKVVVDRDAAVRLGVDPARVDAALYDAFGQRPVSTIYAERNQYFVVMTAGPADTRDPASLGKLFVPSKSGALIPLSTFSHVETTTGPIVVNHQGQFAAATLSFDLAPGVSLSDADQIIRRAMTQIGSPSSVRGGFQGEALAFKKSLSSEPWLLLGALITIYVVLGILYESFIHPITILSTLPSAGVGAILALLITGVELNAMALISLFLLIGIVKKNAIMMVDVAIQTQRVSRLTPREAIFEAALIRLRPILMTTLAAALGALPLAIATGYGADLRRPLGIAIVGGLLFSQFLTLYTTPVVYLYMDRLQQWFQRHWATDRRPIHVTD